MRQLGQMKKSTKNSLFTYTLVIAAFVVVQALRMGPGVGAMLEGQLIPICAYIVMALALNLVVGVSGELSLGHAGFMSIGAFAGSALALALQSTVTLSPLRLALAMVFGAVIAAALGFLIGIPVLRLNGDYLAIVTLAFGEIIKSIITNVYLGVDENGLQFSFLSNKNELADGGVELIRGPMGVMNTQRISTFIAGFVLVLVALVVIVMNVGLIPQVFGRIFSEAFDFQAIFAGFTGSAVMQGVKRGLFSNEAGVGSAPNAAASANVSHPVKQGLVQMLSVFLDTLVICSATAFMLLCSGVEPAVELQGAPYVQSALAASFGTLGPVFITVAMVLFAFTTLIGNLYYVDNALAYLLGHVPSKRFMVVFRLIAMGLIFLGAGLTLDLVWNLSDVLMGVMVLINIPVIAVLSRPAAAALRNYTEQRRAGKNPVFRAADIDLKEKTEYWN